MPHASAAFPSPALLVAQHWKDYEILDSGDGMKLERWGEALLARPDPQVIWPRAAEWKNWDAWYHRSSKGGGRWEFRKKLPDSWSIRYRDLTFKIAPTGFKHTGLFPEQAVNWDWCGEKIRAVKTKGREVSVLNLFGYTGAATAAAAGAGASVCHVDAAKGMVEWCRENARRSGLPDAPIRYIVDDCVAFVRREIRRGKKYDAIIMDPPSYGHGAAGEVWKLEDQLWSLLQNCRELLSEHPVFFLVNSYTTGLSPIALGNVMTRLLSAQGGGLQAGEIGLPITNSNLVLP
ncbi:MAG TPA: class I SAM-dependent methyltransferase, partial [Verrucomicrobiaceae bacterium]